MTLSFSFLDSRMREARGLHVHVPSDSWRTLRAVKENLQQGTVFKSEQALTLIHQALMDLERAITKAKAMLQVTVQGTVRLLDGLKKCAQLRHWRKYDRLLARILDDPRAGATRVLLYWF